MIREYSTLTIADYVILRELNRYGSCGKPALLKITGLPAHVFEERFAAMQKRGLIKNSTTEGVYYAFSEIGVVITDCRNCLGINRL